MSAWDFEDGDEKPDVEEDTDEQQNAEQSGAEPTPEAPEASDEQAEQSQEQPPAEAEGKEQAPQERPEAAAEAEDAAEEPAEEPAEETEPQQAPPPEPEPEPEEEITSMDDIDLDEAAPPELKPGDIVTGTVVSIDEGGVLVDIGGKAEGVVPMYEFLDRSEMPEKGDDIEVAVANLSDDEGMTILSKKSADYERVWNRVMKALETGEILDAMVTDRVKGGLRVDLGVSGFVPASHVATRDVRNLDRFVGRSLRLKVLEADRRRKKVVLSHRLVVEEERKKRREETMERLQEGLVCEGKVRNITDYGAFIDLGGVDGLLHVSEMAWGRVEHPSDVCQVGQTLRVIVLDIDRKKERISLGRRQILPDPWKRVGKEIQPGSTVKGRVNRIVRTGAFVELLKYEVEGFLPIGELVEKRIDSPGEIIEEGQKLDLKVLKMRPQARRMTLSLLAATQEKQRQEMQKHMVDEGKNAPTTLGDQFGDVLGAVAAELGEEAPEAGTAQEAEETGEEADEEAPEAREAAAEEAAEEPEAEEATEATEDAEDAEEVEQEEAASEEPEGEDEADDVEDEADEEGAADETSEEPDREDERDEAESAGDESEDAGDESEDAGDESEDAGDESEDAGDESEDADDESEDADDESEDADDESEDADDDDAEDADSEQ